MRSRLGEAGRGGEGGVGGALGGDTNPNKYGVQKNIIEFHTHTVKLFIQIYRIYYLHVHI
jgi:hypothetical protein